MGSKIEYVDSSHIYATGYARNSKAIGVLWAIFTMCYAIIVVAAFATTEWVGNTSGKLGLFSTCTVETTGEQCRGKLEDIIAITSASVWFLTTTVLVGLAVVTALLTVCAMLMFFFCKSTTVFHVCAWIQLSSAICLVVGCALYPMTWAEENARKVCESSDKYQLGTCEIRWAYVLANIGCLDGIILATLAFILAARHVKLQPDPHYAPPSFFKGEMNGAFMGDAASVAGSRKSLNLHPVLLMHPGQDDTYSQFSQRTVPRSTHSGHYSHPMHHNFQL